MSLKSLIPSPIVSLLHMLVAYGGAFLYGFPSGKLRVIGVTGTKGKTSTCEMLYAIFTAAGYKTAAISSIRASIAGTDLPHPGRSMPGRAYLQYFLSRAVTADCEYAIIEMTSEGSRQHRHRGIELDVLVFLNLTPEHIESHGSYAAYADAKFALGLALEQSKKRPRIMIASAEDSQSARYLDLNVEKRIPFLLSMRTPFSANDREGFFTYEGVSIRVPQPGEFSLKNALAATETARACGVSIEAIQRGIASVTHIDGRMERVEAGQDFTVIVDYAHTPDSLRAVCNTFAGKRRICILGSAGGGRDTWKRPVMARTAEELCDVVIITTDDPYDDDPQLIAEDMAAGMKKKPEIILDRRLAIRRAFESAHPGDVVLITGKGTDPIYGKGGAVIPWNDLLVAREELERQKVGSAQAV